MSIIAFRTDAELEQKLNAAARREKKTRTEIIREALHFYLEGSKSPPGDRPSSRLPQAATALKDYIGVWDGPEDLSSDTGRKVAEYLREKQLRRRL